jgi:hypothetical protein
MKRSKKKALSSAAMRATASERETADPIGNSRQKARPDSRSAA